MAFPLPPETRRGFVGHASSTTCRQLPHPSAATSQYLSVDLFPFGLPSAQLRFLWLLERYAR